MLERKEIEVEDLSTGKLWRMGLLFIRFDDRLVLGKIKMICFTESLIITSLLGMAVN